MRRNMKNLAGSRGWEVMKYTITTYTSGKSI
jgi:hypothetical protein